MTTVITAGYIIAMEIITLLKPMIMRGAIKHEARLNVCVSIYAYKEGVVGEDDEDDVKHKLIIQYTLT